MCFCLFVKSVPKDPFENWKNLPKRDDSLIGFSFQLAITAHPHSVTCNRIAPDTRMKSQNKINLYLYYINFFLVDILFNFYYYSKFNI